MRSHEFIVEEIKVPSRFGKMPFDLYLVSCLFTESSISNITIFNQAVNLVPYVGKKYNLQTGGMCYRGQGSEKSDNNHTIEAIPGLDAVSWTPDKDHAMCFVGQSGKLLKQIIPDSKVVINLISLKELLRLEYQEFYDYYHVGETFEPEILVKL
jgi:hypothetical protein